MTGRKRKTEGLPRSEDDYRTMFENAVVGIFRSTIDGRFLKTNRATARLLGFDSPEELMSSVTDIVNQIYVNPEDGKRYLKLIRKDGVIEDFEAEMYRKDGTAIHVLLNAHIARDEKGAVRYVEGTAQDITEKWKAEKALRQAEEKYRQIYENAIEGIFQASPEGRLISANPALARILGYDSPRDLLNNVRNIVSQVYANERRRKEYFYLMDT
ncbi:MAG: Sporulation kinase E [Syntrophorhabdaceae bacterium PtaU1.Bin034]|nr:MAG: Sporulation kinase E [Syntrophorhabdaceae bacterium PtaU1.Bin034]